MFLISLHLAQEPLGNVRTLRCSVPSVVSLWRETLTTKAQRFTQRTTETVFPIDSLVGNHGHRHDLSTTYPSCAGSNCFINQLYQLFLVINLDRNVDGVTRQVKTERSKFHFVLRSGEQDLRAARD